MSARKVLIVDDDPAVREVLREYLTLEGHRVIVAENGSKAYEYLRSDRFDIVLLDINMPKMDGVETVKAIRGCYPDIPVILISGQDDQDLIQEAIENGANDYFKKPFDIELLLKKYF
jgi:DNA-binding response OmpR family regulator